MVSEAQTGATPDQIDMNKLIEALVAKRVSVRWEWGDGDTTESMTVGEAIWAAGYSIVRTDDVRAVLDELGDKPGVRMAAARLREVCGE